MERLNKDVPEVKLTDEQRAALAEVDSLYESKIAEKEVFLGGLMAKAQAEGNFAELPELEAQKRREITRLEEKRENEKNKLRAQQSGS